MVSEKFESLIQSLYISISHLLSGDIENGRKSILKIISECEGEGSCDEELVSQLLDLVDKIEGYVKGELDESSMMNKIREALRKEGRLRDLLILVLRELCGESSVELMEDWSEDPEPVVRIAYLKCLLKLYEEGIVGIDVLTKFSSDPSPRVREALVSSLSRYANKDEVFGLLSRMLRMEKRSHIRTEILTALSGAIESKRGRRRGFFDRLFKRNS
ncbi:MAG TPA: HEAT repeat domain-containing protein [Candidatus Korarchaeota archaeon]|nr:HEAT repeat domain-containing protein [Candidatus Korarchaeota archaeon]